MLETRNSRFRKMKGRRARDLTYDDLLQIVHLIQSSSRFSEFRLRAGEIEVEIRRANGAPAPAASALDRRPGELPAGTVAVRAPMVGTFYRAPEPGAAPFVEPGQRVAADTTVCIIEVMKLMNSIPAGCAGVVTHVLVKDAEPVEYGQPLIAIRPDA